MMLEMNYLQKPEKNRIQNEKHLKKAGWTGAKKEEEEVFFRAKKRKCISRIGQKPPQKNS